MTFISLENQTMGHIFNKRIASFAKCTAKAKFLLQAMASTRRNGHWIEFRHTDEDRENENNE